MTVTTVKHVRYSFIVAVVVLGAAISERATALCSELPNGQRNQTGATADQVTRLINEGVAALERNDVAEAATLFQQALKLAPKNSAAHTYLGILADRSGNLPEAQRHFEAAASSDPSSAPAKNNLGAVLLKRGLTKQAAAQFEASLKIDSNQPNALINLAQIRFASGTPEDLRAARELFEQAHALGKDAELARALVIVSLRLADREAATKYFREYSDLQSGTQPATTARARSELGAALLEAGLLQEAEAELTSALKLAPMDQDAVLRLARVYIAAKDLPAAGRTLEGAVARGMDAAPVYALLATVYEQSGHIENAIPAMRLAIQREPQSETYRFHYGMLLTNAMAPKAAVIRLTEALETYPDSPRLWLGLGIAHFKAGNNPEAVKAFTQSLKFDANYAPAYAYLGMANVEVGNYKEAINWYERALSVNNKLGVVNYLLAEVLQKTSEPDNGRVETNLRRAVELEPSFAAGRLALGKFYFRTGRLVQAQSELEQVIKLNPELAGAYYQLGLVYTRLKRTA
ncbi:MAG TPA: tetratricopeptide repeat protein, partial [Pyrinomonadaceae bacterium]